jgi:hypothetical protein
MESHIIQRCGFYFLFTCHTSIIFFFIGEQLYTAGNNLILTAAFIAVILYEEAE